MYVLLTADDQKARGLLIVIVQRTNWVKIASNPSSLGDEINLSPVRIIYDGM